MAKITLGADWEIENSNETNTIIRHTPTSNALVFDESGVLDVAETDTEVLNGADISASQADYMLVTDGSGNLQLKSVSVVQGTTDQDIQDAINSDTDHGSSAPHNYFSANPSDLNQEGATTDQAIIWDGSQWTPGDVSTSGTTSFTDEDIRLHAYRDGPTVTVETTSAKSASFTGSDATYGETSVSLLDGWTFELIEAGAWDANASGTSTAEILRTAEGNIPDESTYTSVHTTNDTNKVPTDGSGNPDFSQTLYSFTNTSGSAIRFFFRAINSDSDSSEYPVGGNWTFVRRAP